MAIKAPPANDDYSSSDEAPEEESFSTSTANVLKKVQAQADALKESSKALKEKRRARDTQFKSQKRKLLSEELEDLEAFSDGDQELVQEHRPRVIVQAGKHKKLDEEKDGFKIKVVKKTSKKLPPKSSSLLSRKERFLFRSSVPRK